MTFAPRDKASEVSVVIAPSFSHFAPSAIRDREPVILIGCVDVATPVWPYIAKFAISSPQMTAAPRGLEIAALLFFIIGCDRL